MINRNIVDVHEVRADIIEYEIIPQIVGLFKKFFAFLYKSKLDYIEYMKEADLGVGY